MVKFTLTVEPYAGDENRRREEWREDERADARRQEREERNAQLVKAAMDVFREYIASLNGSRPSVDPLWGYVGAPPSGGRCTKEDCPVCSPGGEATATPRPPDFDYDDPPPDDADDMTRVRDE
jgi:hypothetical protein